MKNFIVVFTGGSGGDLVSNPIITQTRCAGLVKGHRLSERGRMEPNFDTEWIKKFPSQPERHVYGRDWSADLSELEMLQPWLLHITDTQQASIIKKHFGDRVISIALVYDRDCHDFVLSSFAHKVLDSPDYLTRDSIGEKFLHTAAHTKDEREYLIGLGQQGKLGDWYCEHFIPGKNWPPLTYHWDADIKLSVRQLLTPHGLRDAYIQISQISGIEFDLDAVDSLHQRWLDLQQQWIR